MTSITTRRPTVGKQLQGLGYSTVTVLLTAAMPKCPLCWAALMSAVAVGPAINFYWLRPVAVLLLLISIAVAFFRSRMREAFGPFYVTVAAAISMYLFKFTLNHDGGVYEAG